MLLIKRRTGGGDLPHGADHPGHRLIYMRPTRQGLYNMGGYSRNAITIYNLPTLSTKYSWSTKDSVYDLKSHVIFQIFSTIKSPNGRNTNIGKV